jgi:ubiquinone/menaquinone biosynthesis C-methylase UbiE
MKNSEIPQHLYDENYYNNNCDGYTPNGEPGPRLKKLFSYIKGPSTIIDIGCGRGELSKSLSNTCQILSVDYSYASCKIFEKIIGDSQPFLRHDVSKGLPWIKDEYFEIAVLSDIMEHLYDEQLSILCPEILRITKKEGLILIDTPILENGNSTLHVNVKKDIKEITEFFPNTIIEDTSWYKKPYHCNIILRKQ